MTYALAIDVGTTYTAAAVARAGRSEVVSLGDRAPAIPTVALLREDGEVIVGDAAERRARFEPERAAREFKRRLGDTAPFLLASTPYGAETLVGHVLRHVLDRVRQEQGGDPAVLVVTHPANWGPYKRDLLLEAIRFADPRGAGVMLLSEPEAAAFYYATQEKLEPGEVVAVYDLGGGTFDAAVLRRTELGFEFLGPPGGIERLGGIDFDQAVFAHVDGVLGGRLAGADTADPAVFQAVAGVRDDARAAKEALSADTETSISVGLPGEPTRVRLTRAELEDALRPRLRDTVDALERVVAAAGLTFADVTRVLLVGGSSRTPLVAELVGERTGRPVTSDAQPKFAVALGAAAAGAAGLDEPASASAGDSAAEHQTGPVAARSPRRRRLVAAGVAAVALVAVTLLAIGGAREPDVAVAAAGRDDPAAEAAPREPASTTTTVATPGSVAVADAATPPTDGAVPANNPTAVPDPVPPAGSGSAPPPAPSPASPAPAPAPPPARPAPAPPAAPAPAPTSLAGRIVFSSSRAGNSELFAMNADGSGLVRLTTTPELESNPALSPDGRRVAFSVNGDLFVMNVDGSGRARMTSTPNLEVEPDWSPDGTRIAFTLRAPADNRGHIYVVNANGTNLRSLVATSVDEGRPSWSPDGTRIAFETNGGGDYEVAVFAFAQGSVTLATNNAVNDGEPDWSPDGSRIAFASTRNGAQHVFAMAASGAGQTDLTPGAAASRFPVWSRDGAQIAFVRNNDVHRMTAAGGGVVNLTNHPAFDGDPGF
jgi:molecular chaperone DnaK (HSP70)/Tol biopolymer transport system component